MPQGRPLRTLKAKRRGLLTSAEMAAELGYGERMLYGWLKAALSPPDPEDPTQTPDGAPRLEGAKKIGGKWFISRRDLRRFKRSWGLA